MTDTKSYKSVMALLSDRVNDVADFAAKFGLLDGQPLSDIMDLVKTISQYRRALRRAVLLFWRGDEDTFQFIDRMIYATDEQFRRAWREGMREIGLDPANMRPEWGAVLEGRIAGEQNYVLSFAEAIRKARDTGAPIDPLYTRVELWVNKYNEVKELAKVTCGKEKRYRFNLGGAVDHCDTCAWLDGVVAFGDVWAGSGVMPQSRSLICGGYNCQCGLTETQDPITKKQPEGAPRG